MSSDISCGQLDDVAHLVFDYGVNDAHQQPASSDIQIFTVAFLVSSVVSAICMTTLEARATLRFALDIIPGTTILVDCSYFVIHINWELDVRLNMHTAKNSKHQKNWIH